MTRHPAIESLEARIAPAITVFHPIPDIVAGVGKTTASIDLEALVDEAGTHRTQVKFTTNFKLPGETDFAVITLELFDDKAPLSVQNFLSYLNSDSYDGTFFHRIFDFDQNLQPGQSPVSEPGTDIIQAGGFDVTNLTKHIPTEITLHNEYNANDPEVQNTRGTIAMAKTAVSPHTATSEWFINLTNNSSILGAGNNGGYTVFGKITDESLAVVDAIGQAMKINRGGALTDLPVRDYEAGDGRPTANQLFVIQSAEIIAPPNTNAEGYTFSVQAVVPGTSTPSPLLTTSVDATNNLNLTYLTGQTGQADITVTINKAGEPSVTDTFRVTVNPNLFTDLRSHTLLQQFVPGETGKSTITVSNNGGAAATGTVKLQLFLSQVINNGNDPLTFTVDANDVLLEEKEVAINIPSGESTTLPLDFDVDYKVDDKVLIDGKTYVVVARVDTSEAGFGELFSDDNDGAFRSGHIFNLATGELGDRKNVPFTLDGVTFSLKGNGKATLIPNGDGTFDVSVAGTDAKTRFTVKAASDANLDLLEDINILSTIGRVDLRSAVFNGDFAASEGAKNLTFGDLNGDGIDQTISVNVFPGGTQKLALSFGDVTDFSLASSMPISKLTAKSWSDTEATTGADEIFATGLGSLKITGDFEASLFNASTQRIAQIHVGGALNGVTIQTLGDIGSVKLGSMTSSNIFAGLDQKPNDRADFSEGRTISSFKVTGTVSDSVIAAAKFNSIVLGDVDTAAGINTKGIYADAIKSYPRKDVGGAKLSRLDDITPDTEEPTVYNASGNYEVAVF